MKNLIIIILSLLIFPSAEAQKRKKNNVDQTVDTSLFKALKWRNIGPFRGGRSVASSGVVSNPMTYYMGSTGGGLWKTEDAGISWENISDGYFKTGTVGAVSVSESDPNVIYVGMGEHPVRGVMTSSGDGVYKSTDAGKTWKHAGLEKSRHISDVIIDPNNPEIVYVAVQGALYGSTPDRGIYKTTDGGETWRKVLFVANNTGASSLSMDFNNPRILYAAMWQHQRYPWTMESGGDNSGLYKSTDAGETWEKMEEGLPEGFGKSGVSVSRANSEIVYAIIEAEAGKSGLYKSMDAGKKWKLINKQRVLVTRSWYYMEVFADPVDENKVFVLNAPVMKSIDGGKSFVNVPVPHGDNHHLWINPTNNQYMINSNDGGANVSLNGGKSWSTQQNQPTAQFYRVITDNLVPYHVYGGQQDNSAIAIASRTNDGGIGWKDWYSVAGCESAFLAFDENNPEIVYGGCYQGIIDVWNKQTNENKPIKEYPELSLSGVPKNFKYRYNWNAPILASPQEPGTIYHAGNVVFKTTDGGINWEVISPDLTRNDTTKQGPGGGPYTNEAAGGENYNTIMALAIDASNENIIWSGSDDGLVHVTRDGGRNWKKISADNMDGIINSIELSVHEEGAAYITMMRYKWNDLKSYAYKVTDYGATWTPITNGFNDPNGFVRVIREDKKVAGLLYAGTEVGMYVSFNDGALWQQLQLNLPVVPINDLAIRQNDLIAATAGRSFWILDDLGSIQQSKGQLSDKPLLFQSKDSYLLIGGNSDSKNQGKNPVSGITIDYYLPEEIPDSIAIQINIKQGGEIIRSYSSKEDKSFKTWQGGPPKPKVLPVKKGINRFTWDFRRNALPAVDGIFVYGDYRGSTVAPGDYVIEFIHPDDTLLIHDQVLSNPNMKINANNYIDQQAFLKRITRIIKSIHESVNEIRVVKSQLKGYQKLLDNQEEAAALVDTAKAIVVKIEDWENRLIQPKQKTFQDVINFQNQLNAELMNLKSFVDVTYPEVTTGAKERLADLEADWFTFREQKNELISQDFALFNQMYKDLNLPALIQKK